MEISVLKLLVILVIVFVIFGAGKLPQMMGDLGKGVRSLKDGMKDETAKSDIPPVVVTSDPDKHA